MTTLDADAVLFFYDNAGYSWDKLRESKEVGRRRCAEELAEAERWASEQGHSVEWDYDSDIDSSDFSDDPYPYKLWVASLLDGDGLSLASLCGIDLGRDGDPSNNPYSRVIAAALALDALSMGE